MYAGKYATINEYFKAEEEVIVQNSSAPLGIVSLALGEKGDEYISLPKSTIPIVLSDRVTKDKIVKSTAFRDFVSKGVVRLVTLDQYKEILKSRPEDEVKEVQVQAEELQKKQVDVSSPQKTAELTNQSGAADVNDPQVNPRVLQVVHSLKTPEGSDTRGVVPKDNAVIDEFESLELTDTDYTFIITNTKGKIRKWAQRRLDALIGD